MEDRRTRAYWPTRIMLAFAIVAPPTAWLWLVAMQPDTIAPMFAANPERDWVDGAILAVGAGLWFAGVIWMIRIFRGPSDDRPRWRYRVR
jgi:hypothetical protein